MRYLVPPWIQQIRLVERFVLDVFPRVDSNLSTWRERLSFCPEPALSQQAMLSMQKKRFHALGGSVYSLYGLDEQKDALISFIVAYQTISDYLDNLCDRMGFADQDAFRQLHTAMTDAITVFPIDRDYYRHYPIKNDGGYLTGLVDHCRSVCSRLPSFATTSPQARWLASLYSDLQVFKHIDVDDRERALVDWFEGYRKQFGDLFWWEFAAATGSTLGVFALASSATFAAISQREVDLLTSAYFPWVTGLHILLDYLIDIEEDRSAHDLNFVSYYKDMDQCSQRLTLFVSKALQSVEALPRPWFHKTVIKGLLAMYLSDPKVEDQGLGKTARKLLTIGGRDAWIMYAVCKGLRRTGKI